MDQQRPDQAPKASPAERDWSQARWVTVESGDYQTDLTGPLIVFSSGADGKIEVVAMFAYVFSNRADGEFAEGIFGSQLYTPAEWRAFLNGVKEGEFDPSDENPFIGVRDSKDPEGAILLFPAEVFGIFVGRVREGVYDLPDSA